MKEPIITIATSKEDISDKLSGLIQAAANAAIDNSKDFFIGISGGSMIGFLTEALLKVKTDYSKWKIFFNDERVVPEDNADSTFGACKEMIGKVADLTEDNFVKMKQGLSAKDAATDYENKLKTYFNTDELPKFNMLLLGMGDDGHTCSLFPGHELLKETSLYVASIEDSPKKPPQRITFTYPILNNANCIVFVVTGELKADKVEKVLRKKDKSIPATLVQPSLGKLHWILDKDAAKNMLD